MDITLDDKLNVLQQISQRKLVEILDVIPGTKDLIIEQKLMKILDSFVGVTVLKSVLLVSFVCVSVPSSRANRIVSRSGDMEWTKFIKWRRA